MHSMIKMFLAIALLAAAGVANAVETSRFDCSLWASVVSKSLFFNTGTFATKGPAFMAVPECVDKKTGFYGNLFLLAPIGNFDIGKEIDVRLGKRFKAGGLDVDASIANYYFGVGPGSANMYDTGNGRVRISHTFDIGNGVSIEPYGYADYQHSFKLHDNAFALAGGAVFSSKLNGLPGKPNLTFDLGSWKYTTTWAPNKGPITTANIALGYQVSRNITLGPRFLQSWGNVSNTSDKPKNMYGAFAAITF